MDQEIEQLKTFSETLVEYLKVNSPQIIAAAAIVFFGFLAARLVSKFVDRTCSKRNLDITLTRFFASAIRLIIIGIFLILAINKIGIEITPFIALLGASAFGLSLAVQGPLSNYGAGIVLIITRPFKVKDTLTLHGLTGIVQTINLGNTQLLTEDGQEITIPNRSVLGEILTNSFQLMVVEGVVGVDYACDPERAIAAVRTAVEGIAEVSTERAPQVGIQAFGDSSIEIAYRYWIPTSNYFVIQYAVNLAVFKSLKQVGITIPFPQRDVRLVKDEK
ncbi:mechanosensitive ion channel family protein [Pelagicoccus sp. SDUM812003]|uniref:mechanosensitive ion channel family protein n=1 Tax=Pelagicoccus sp. SDUM812003 TaxID=3041267 RepID=UPI00280D93E5|nr:mechanosensitive ion channel family protein [Pelagicoccus sp. SDUM812003]MDQ8204437.1 mechanosensitive ion channel family protein [Pelagicoccus sp. SDUM812003]